MQKLDAAIIDIVLPDGDGVEVARRSGSGRTMPILVLSAIGEEDEKVRALEAGADDYVTKPFGPRELVARLEAALRRAAPADDTAGAAWRTGSSWTSPPMSRARSGRGDPPHARRSSTCSRR